MPSQGCHSPPGALGRGLRTSGGVSERLGGFVWGDRMSLRCRSPANATGSRGMWGPSGARGGCCDHSLCQPELSGASCLCFPLPPSIFSPKSPVFIPLKQLFAVQTPIWDPWVPPPSSPRWEVLFYPPYNAEGQGCSSVSFPAVGFLRAGFAPPNCRNWGWRVSRTGNHIPTPTQASDRVGKTPPAGNTRSRGNFLAQTPGQGRETEFGFLPAFSRCFYSTRSSQEKSGMRRGCGV